MKILMLTWNYPPAVGGIEQVAYHLANGLQNEDHQLDVIAAGVPPDAEPATVEQAVHRPKRTGLPAFLIYAFFKGFGRIRKNRPDVLLCPSLTSAPVAWLLSVLTGVPFAVLVHGSDLLIDNMVYQTGLRLFLKKASFLFANSHNTARLAKEKGATDSSIHIIHPGVNPPPKLTTPPSAHVQQLLSDLQNRPILLSVGRLVERKGTIDFVVKNMPDLMKRIPDVAYLIVGGEPKGSLIHREKLTEKLQSTIQAYAMEDHVYLLGTLSPADLEAVYQHADLFIFPCQDMAHDVEGFGIVLLEAALRGVPCVATRSGGIPDAVEHEKTGLLVPGGDSHALTDITAQLLQNDELRKQLGARARERAQREFTWDVIAKQYSQIVRERLTIY